MTVRAETWSAGQCYLFEREALSGSHQLILRNAHVQ